LGLVERGKAASPGRNRRIRFRCELTAHEHQRSTGTGISTSYSLCRGAKCTCEERCSLNAAQGSVPGSMKREWADSRWELRVSGLATHCSAHMANQDHSGWHSQQALADDDRGWVFARRLVGWRPMGAKSENSLDVEPPAVSNRWKTSTLVHSTSCSALEGDRIMGCSMGMGTENMPVS
jgi:hypothetical protein